MLKSMINPDLTCPVKSIFYISPGSGKTRPFKIIFLLLGISLFISSIVFAGPNENACIRFDLDAITYGNQNDTTMVTPAVGEYIRVDVYAINVHNLDTYEFEVNFNPGHLDYIITTPTNPITFEPNILTTNGGMALGWMIDTSDPGVLSIAYTLAGTDTLLAPEGEGLIADIVFQVLSTVEDSLSFNDVYFYDSSGAMDIITDKGTAIITGLVTADNNEYDSLSKEIKLENYPNPFNPSTTISFNLSAEHKDNVEILIYNMKGQKVKQFIINNTSSSIPNHVTWDGNDDQNNPVSSGIYFYKLKAGNFVSTRKMILMK